MAGPRTIEATVYLALEPVFSRHVRGEDGTPAVEGLRISGMTKKRPGAGKPCVRLRLRLPARAFAPLAPEVTIEVDEDTMSIPEPQVTVEHPDDPLEPGA